MWLRRCRVTVTWCVAVLLLRLLQRQTRNETWLGILGYFHSFFFCFMINLSTASSSLPLMRLSEKGYVLWPVAKTKGTSPHSAATSSANLSKHVWLCIYDVRENSFSLSSLSFLKAKKAVFKNKNKNKNYSLSKPLEVPILRRHVSAILFSINLIATMESKVYLGDSGQLEPTFKATFKILVVIYSWSLGSHFRRSTQLPKVCYSL